ncbi:YkgJ family cysteine cluster protein [bacterium]|nr:YkgJ family cysteine cluster protein [bacterium]
MEDLTKSVSNLRKRYREIFLTSVEEIKKRVDDLKPVDCGDIFDKYLSNSAGEFWQKAVLRMFEEDISKEIHRKWMEILAYRKEFSCVGCGTCCKLACSEFSPEILNQKKQNGDRFATQFLSVFVPYNSKEEAREIYPEYIKMLEENKEEDVYFYHCPKINECNRCSDYENRPQICRDFPDNPLALLPKSCGYVKWKEEVEPIALMLHSMLEIISYYKEHINANIDRT